ncbi:MAG: RNA methyltransferase [Candidatus Pacebacteria bacterium]|nr:RNA methyltransferase [Candidatus Paceibacterota bacterium]
MRLHRFYIGGKNGVNLADLKVSDRFILDTLQNENFSALIHQWKDVFRYMPGSRVVLFDDSKTECLCMIEIFGNFKTELVILEKADLSKQGSTGEVREEGLDGRMSSTANRAAKNEELWLFLSILKNDNFDLVVQKATELGVDHVVPLLCDRTIKKNINLKRAEKIAIEASEQSGRTSVPVVHEPIALKKAVEDFLANDGDLVVCHQRGDEWLKGKELLKKYPLGFIVGPEGGWSEKEEVYFDKMSLRKIKFSENVLRAETAAIGVVTLVRVG